MEYILELKNNQITLPESLIKELELKSDTKFKATIFGENFQKASYNVYAKELLV